MSYSAADRLFMQQAIRLAAMGRGRTHPNPMVGCVIVNNGRVVGTGYHRKKGEPHAETFALREAGELARGATAYVSLEPCAHVGLTPPCAGSLVQAGVARVVAAMVDPDPRVAGRGLEHLRSAGVDVQVGLLEEEARALNRSWLTWKTTGRPLVILKWASTLDGKIACANGDSRWVTGDEARAHLHQVRDQVDAILVGQNTVQRDDPELTARPSGPGPLPGWAGGCDPGPDPDWQPKDPLRIVLDSMARVGLDARVVSPDLLTGRPRPNKTVIAHGVRASRLKLQALRDLGAETLELPSEDDVLALGPLLDVLGRRGITSLLVEGGARVHWSFLSQGLGDYLMVYAAPKIVGGAGAPGPVAGPGLRAMDSAWNVRIQKMTTIGADLLVEGDLKDVHRAD
ncbi:MAG TPA: bifunctional diaminohydroxyphosphoribosylaminopyrimidine deaminase/5-amino-6-(5-phosphoribosylamino)uracil reductase RibD [Symbiobacteriaceae bacterium]|nr:bifunctional diaminohydroxyphosphoribosylaminopyrimidine deaminase/5-amino-6-(5-phosphoribosylamino)uracil reductase RibD [Symbiobacteriaceae bacterium]